jgi:hypothetical protein
VPGPSEYEIDWVDRETLAYRSAGLTVLVWVDLEVDLISRGRIFHTGSICEWLGSDSRPVRPVTSSEKREIISAIQSHYAKERRPCRLEE